MEKFIKEFSDQVSSALAKVPSREVAKALKILHGVYERNGRVYVFGNGGSLALATHFVADLNKTVFSHNLDKHKRRFQAIRLPSTETEITAWANDVGYNMVFAGPLQNYLQEGDAVIAISSSGNSSNIIKAVELAKKNGVPVIGMSGFDGGKLNKLADSKVLVPTAKGDYEIVESVHAALLHMMVKYFKNAFDYMVETGRIA
ncbi:MAG: Phosphoheptose isomerase [Parcubacteria group bacterium GW2011_GWA2_51_10]|nr:MAG: Phosphoheptose isomerase [Parcubacteria group bacterium GW2011_GWA2_51_10]